MDRNKFESKLEKVIGKSVSSRVRRGLLKDSVLKLVDEYLSSSNISGALVVPVDIDEEKIEKFKKEWADVVSSENNSLVFKEE